MIAPRDPRRARLASIRSRIADGTYDTPDKLAAAVDAWLTQHDATEIQADGLSDAQPESPSEQLRRRKPK